MSGEAQPTHRFVVVDDHPLFRGALRGVLERGDRGVVIDEAGALDAVVDLIGDAEAVDLILLDLAMPGVRGFSGLMFLRAQFPSIPVVVVSATEDPDTIRRSLEFGAAGFIPKSLGTDAIRKAVDTVLAGGVWTPDSIDLRGGGAESAVARRLATLTPQQVRVLMMLSEGLLNKQIAYELKVSEATVKAHVSAILQKLGVESRTQAVIAAGGLASARWPVAVLG